MILKKWLESKWVAVLWLLVMTCLFILPASALPRENWMGRIFLDKWIHLVLFAILVIAWLSAFKFPVSPTVASFILYGFLIEIVQGLFIRNRSFDLFDLVADAAGSFIGMVVWLRVYKKNKPL